MVLTSVAISAFSSACGLPKFYTLQKGVGHFSVALPPGYRVTMVEKREDSGYTDVRIDGPRNDRKNIYSAVDVFIITANKTYPNALNWLEWGLASVNDYPNFELLDRSKYRLGDITAEQYVYRHTSFADECLPPKAARTRIISREIVFDYEGKIWSIDLSYWENESRSYEADFEYILQSLKILK